MIRPARHPRRPAQAHRPHLLAASADAGGRIPRLFLVAGPGPPTTWRSCSTGRPHCDRARGLFAKLGPLAAIGNAINTFSYSLTQYNYMRLTVILGPLVAYLIHCERPQEASRAGAGGGHAAAVTAHAAGRCPGAMEPLPYLRTVAARLGLLR